MLPPEPFNLPKELSLTSDEIEPLPNNLHLSSSSIRHISHKNVSNQTEQIQCLSSSENFLDNQESETLFIVDKVAVADLPQAVLPEPFNLSTELSSTTDEIVPLPNNLHFTSCSKRQFSDKNVANQTEQIQCFSSSGNFLDNQESEAHGRKNVHCCLIM